MKNVPGAKSPGQECMGVLGGQRCVMERRQEKEPGPHFQEVGLYSGIMGKRFLTLGFETGKGIVGVKFNSIQHLG